MNPPSNNHDIITRLAGCGISRGDVLYVHSSMDWIGGGVNRARSIIDALIELVGPEGTVCMPSMTWVIPQAFGPSEGVTIDIRRSPSAVGLISEIFRRKNGVKRSVSYYAPVCAFGHRATEFLEGQHKVIHPFGPDSTFRRVMEAGGKSVGLGVALNMSSLAHLPDYDLVSICPLKIFSDQFVQGEVIDYEGIQHHIRNVSVRPEVVPYFRPSATFEHSERLRKQLHFQKWGDAFVFVYPSQVYYEEAISLGKEFLASGKLPPWITTKSWIPERYRVFP